MTVLNVHVTRDRALLCTDTATVSADRSNRSEVSKIFYLPHANIAMAGRGVQALTLGLFEGAWMSGIAHLDQLENMWTVPALDQFYAQFPAMMQNNGYGGGELTAAEVVVVGLSHRRGRMTALHYVKRPEAPFAKHDRDAGLIAPVPPDPPARVGFDHVDG